MLNVKYVDNNIIIINKSIGIEMKDLIKNKNYILNKNVYNFGILNRLDKYTSGIILIARNNNFYFFYKKLIIKKLIKKNYLTIVSSNKNKGFVNLSILKKKNNKINKNKKNSITYYNFILKKKKNYLNICLKTGRTHQIRLHLNHINLYILNEYYIKKQKKYLNTLHYNSIKFFYPIIKKKFFLILCLPKEFKKHILINNIK